MLFRRKAHQDDIVILFLDRQLLVQPDTFFTDGNTASDLTKFFNDSRDLARLDWDCIFRATYWNDSEDNKRKWRAEVLVPGCVPFERVERVIDRAQQTQHKLQIDLPNVNCEIQTQWYFDV